MIQRGDIIVHKLDKQTHRLFVVNNPTRHIDPVILVPESEYFRDPAIELKLEFEGRETGKVFTESIALLFDVVEDSYLVSQVYELISSRKFANFSLGPYRVTEASSAALLEAARGSGMPDDLKKLLS